MIHRQIFRGILALALLAAAPSALSFPLNYGGRLVSATGQPLEGTVSLTFGFYSSLAATTPINSYEVTKAVSLRDGVFQVELLVPDVDAAAIFANPSTPVYMEVKNAGSGVAYQRQKFSMVPYALAVPVDNMTIG